MQNITGTMRITTEKSSDHFISLLAATQTNLDLQTYDFTEKKIKTFFEKLLARGTNIRLIMEDKKFQQFKSTFKQIQNYFSGYANFQIKSDRQMGTEYTHSKINIIDSGFIIQTANLTHTSLFENREHFFWSQNADVLSSLRVIFEKDWKGEKIQMSDIHPNLVICNINCRVVIEKLLRDAKKSIIIQTQYITDPNITNILKTQAVGEKKILVANTDDNLDLLKTFGNEVVKRLKKPYNHTKMILIDHKILLLGSMNLSSNSLDKNREVGILLVDPSLIQEFLGGFERDWNRSQ